MAGSKRVFNSAQLRFFLHENCIINAFACTEKTEGRERKRTGHNIDGDNVNYAGSGAPLRASEACVEPSRLGTERCSGSTFVFSEIENTFYNAVAYVILTIEQKMKIC